MPQKEYFFDIGEFRKILIAGGVTDSLAEAVCNGFKISEIKIRGKHGLTGHLAGKNQRIDFYGFKGETRDYLRRGAIPLREIALVHPGTGSEVILQLISIEFKRRVFSTIVPMFQAQAHLGSYSVPFPKDFHKTYLKELERLPQKYSFFLTPYRDNEEKTAYSLPIGFADSEENITYLDEEKTQAKLNVTCEMAGVGEDVFAKIQRSLFNAAQESSMFNICPVFLNIMLGSQRDTALLNQNPNWGWWEENHYFYMTMLFILLTSFIEMNHARFKYRTRDVEIARRMMMGMKNYLKRPDYYLDAITRTIRNTENVLIKGGNAKVEEVEKLYTAVVLNRPELVDGLPTSDRMKGWIKNAIPTFHDFALGMFPYFRALPENNIQITTRLF